MSGDKKTCAVILNWNGWTDTCECLTSLINAERVPDTIVVVDNGSTDNSVDEILAFGRRHFSTILVDDSVPEFGSVASFVCLRNTENSGYGAGNNRGITWALGQGFFDFIWLLNNDTLARPASLNNLLCCAEESDAAVLGATVLYADSLDLVQCAGGCRYNALTSILRPSLAGVTLEQAFDVEDDPPLDYIYGASMFVCSKIFEVVGLLREDYFLFYEELDFCERLKKQGFTLKWCRRAVVEHKVARSVGRLDAGKHGGRMLANYHENLSTLIFTWRFHRAIFPFLFLFRFLGKGVLVVLRREWSLLLPLFRAYRDFCCGTIHTRVDGL